MVERALVVEDEPLIGIDREAIDVCGSAQIQGTAVERSNP